MLGNTFWMWPQGNPNIDFQEYFCNVSLQVVNEDGTREDQLGITITAQCFGRDDSCFAYPQFNRLSGLLVGAGYTPGEDYRVAYYDWRQGPQALNRSGWMSAVVGLVEEMQAALPEENNVVVIAHGAGCTHAYFLFAYVVDRTWKDEHIQQLILLGNSIFGGLPVTPVLAYLGTTSDWPDLGGPTLQWSWLGASDYSTWVLPDATVWASMGNLWYWSDGDFLAWNAAQLDDFGDFLGISQYWEYAIANNNYAYPGWASSHPGVNTTIICGDGLVTSPIRTELFATVQQLYLINTTAGDNIVPLTTCSQISSWTSPAYSTEYFVVSGVPHENLCCDPASRIDWWQHIFRLRFRVQHRICHLLWWYWRIVGKE